MATQIKNKFIGNDQVTGAKIKLAQGEALRGKDSLGNDIDLIKLDGSDKVIVKGNEVALKSQVDQVQSNLDTEISARQAGDVSTLADAKAYADAKVSALVDSAPAVLDTLRELAEALSNDPNFATTITATIGNVSSALTSEVARATSAENTIATNLASEVTRATNAESAIASDLASEITRATNAESALSASIASSNSALNDEIARAESAEATIASNLASEVTRATNAESALNTAITNEVTRATTAEAGISARVTTLESYIRLTEKVVVTATHISQGYVDLAHQAITAQGFNAFYERLALFSGASEDYTLSIVGGVTRVTFRNSLTPTGAEALAVGDNLYFRYAYL